MTTAVTILATSTVVSPVSTAAPPTAPDQAPKTQSLFKASIPAITFVTCTVGGVIIIILLGLLFVKLYKKGRDKKEQEDHEQWLARQNLHREEQKVQRMALGGWYARQDGIHGRDFAAPAGSRKQGYWAPVELKTLQKGREWA